VNKENDRFKAIKGLRITNPRLIRKVVFRILLIYGIASGVNFIWEMLQMPFYEKMSFTDPESYLKCLQARGGDENIIIVIYRLGLLSFREWSWPVRLTISRIAYLVFVGGSIAILIELLALKNVRWYYTSLMPILLLARIGLIPFLQMIVLPYLSFLISSRAKILRR
jgi:hypothetical protein